MAAVARDRRQHVVAQSMGGVVAAGLPLTYPRKVRRRVLAATSGNLDSSVLAQSTGAQTTPRRLPTPRPGSPDQLVDYIARLSGIEIPRCLIWGDDNPISPPAVRGALAQPLPNSIRYVPSMTPHLTGSPTSWWAARPANHPIRHRDS